MLSPDSSLQIAVCPAQRGSQIRHVLASLLFALLWLAPPAEAAENAIQLELNAVENAENRCWITFVVQNKDEAALESLKLDLAVFRRDGIVYRRLITEMGPLRPRKTMVKAFGIDGECAQIGGVLVNDVNACVPGDVSSCLDRLVLRSRVVNVRFFK
jgi:hypothetical protein